MQAIYNIILLDLDRLFQTHTERDLVINMVIKSVSLMLENPDIMKRSSCKDTVLEIICHCAAHYQSEQDQGFRVDIVLKYRIIEEYLREEYLADFVAEILDSCTVTYESSTLSDAVLLYFIIILGIWPSRSFRTRISLPRQFQSFYSKYLNYNPRKF